MCCHPIRLLSAFFISKGKVNAEFIAVFWIDSCKARREGERNEERPVIDTFNCILSHEVEE